MDSTADTTNKAWTPPDHTRRLLRRRACPPGPAPERQRSSAPNIRADDVDTSRRNNFDVIRFSLALIVVVSHSFGLLGAEPAAREPLFVLSRGQATLGQAAVYGFFVISGYLITMSWDRGRGAGEFFRRRIRRIYPGFAAAAIFGAFVALPLSGHAFPNLSGLAYLAYQILFLEMPLADPAVFPRNPVPGFLNGSMWTIRHEVWCYVAVGTLGAAALFRGGRRWMLAGALIASLALLVAMSAARWDAHWPTSLAANPLGAWLFGLLGSAKAWPGLAAAFLAGACCYLVRGTLPWHGVAGAAVAAFSVIVMAVAMLVPPLFAIVLPVAIAFPLLWLAFLPSRLAGFARRGDFSYGVYLYAFPIQQLIVCHMPGISVGMMVLISALLSIVAGVMSWHLVERWFLRPSTQSLANR